MRRDIEVIARAGLGLDDFLDETLSSLHRALSFDAACVATVDPATLIITSARKYGGLRGADDHDVAWGQQEYGTPEATSFPLLASATKRAVGTHLLTEGHLERSPRMTEFIRPLFGYADELRGVCTDDRDSTWGGVALFRDPGRPFDADETAFLAELTPSLALGIRSGILARIATALVPANRGPAVLITDGRGEIVQATPGARDELDRLVPGPAAGSPAGIISLIAGAARRYATGESATPPRARLRTSSGQWLVVHAAPLDAAGSTGGQVVVTIEEARPPEIVALVVAAYDLTPRERDIVQLVLQGLDTKEIAQAVFLSSYTVQDHLKAIFDKVGVRSRRELVAKIYVDQYVPRIGAELGPSGWFVGST